MEYTKGEWQIGQTATGKIKIQDKNGFSIANLTSNVELENKANAKIISAAPDLLKALLEMKMQLIQWGNQEEGTIGKQWADKALAAIQKATA